MSHQLDVGASAVIKAQFGHSSGKPCRIDAPPSWESSNPAVLTVAPAADGFSATLTAVAPGTAQVSMSAKAGGQTLAAPPLEVVVEHVAADTAAIVLT